MDSVKDSLEVLHLPDSQFGHPVAYTFMYVQWEANRVILPPWHQPAQIIARQLVRNLGLAFSMIAVISLVLIADPVVRCPESLVTPSPASSSSPASPSPSWRSLAAPTSWASPSRLSPR